MKFSICAILLFCAGLFAGEKPTADDPLEWTPPKTRPVFPALPSETPELKARFEIAIRESEDYTKEVNSWPGNCAQIGNVLKDSQLAKLGLKIGDIITKFDDTVVVEGGVTKFRKEGAVQMRLFGASERDTGLSISNLEN